MYPAPGGTRGGAGSAPSTPHLSGVPPFGSRPLPRLPTESSVLTEPTLPVKARYAMRIGLNYVRDLGEEGRKAIVEDRDRGGPYLSFTHFINRMRGGPICPRPDPNLVMVGAFDALGQPRRELLWGWQERWHGQGPRRGIDK